MGIHIHDPIIFVKHIFRRGLIMCITTELEQKGFFATLSMKLNTYGNFYVKDSKISKIC